MFSRRASKTRADSTRMNGYRLECGRRRKCCLRILRTLGWIIALSFRSLVLFRKTSDASQCLSSFPWGVKACGPNARRSASRIFRSDRVSCVAISSAEKTDRPRFLNNRQTVDFPDPIPPVTAMTRLRPSEICADLLRVCDRPEFRG